MKFSQITHFALWSVMLILPLAPPVAADSAAVEAAPISCSHNIMVMGTHWRGEEIKGHVLLAAILDTMGQIKSADIISSEPRGFFDRAVMNAATHWKFKEMSQNVAVRVKTHLTQNLDLSRPDCDEVRVIDQASLTGEEIIALRTFLDGRGTSSRPN